MHVFSVPREGGVEMPSLAITYLALVACGKNLLCVALSNLIVMN